MVPIKRFKIDISNLSEREKIVFEKLLLAAEAIAPIYLKQKNNRYPGANFYPPGVSREEIEKAAQKNPSILDPYTMVEKDKKGRFRAVPFHQRFRKELGCVAKLLREAAKFSDDKDFAFYLKERAKSLLNGNYAKSEIIWLQSKTFRSKFSFIIGPIERYLDTLFFKKCGYQAWVGIIDEQRTKKLQGIKDMILMSQRKILPKSKKVDVSKLRIRVDQINLFSGLIADFMFTGTNLPNDIELMKEYGSNLIIFNTSLELKFQEDQMPIFRAIFRKDFQASYPAEELYEASLLCIALHEISHSLIRYEDAEERLQELFPVFDEILAYVLGIKACGPLLLKGVLSQRELEAILVMHICRHFTWWLDSFKNLGAKNYTIGAAIAMNFFVEEGAIKISNGISWPDFTKMFICINELSTVLEYYLALGSYDEAKEFVKNYKSFKIFEYFDKKLKLKGLKK